MGLYIVVKVDGSWEISDSFLVTRYNMKYYSDVFEINEMLYYTITSTKYLELAYFCEKWSLIENCNN